MIKTMLAIQHYLRMEGQYYSDKHIINKEYLDAARDELILAISTHKTTMFDHKSKGNRSVEIMIRAIAATNKLLVLQDLYKEKRYKCHLDDMKKQKEVVKALQADYKNPRGYKASSYHSWAFR
jgi:hypothetical protein